MSECFFRSMFCTLCRTSLLMSLSSFATKWELPRRFPLTRFLWRIFKQIKVFREEKRKPYGLIFSCRSSKYLRYSVILCNEILIFEAGFPELLREREKSYTCWFFFFRIIKLLLFGMPLMIPQNVWFQRIKPYTVNERGSFYEL